MIFLRKKYVGYMLLEAIICGTQDFLANKGILSS
jgi:hypothetical protein